MTLIDPSSAGQCFTAILYSKDLQKLPMEKRRACLRFTSMRSKGGDEEAISHALNEALDEVLNLIDQGLITDLTLKAQLSLGPEHDSTKSTPATEPTAHEAGVDEPSMGDELPTGATPADASEADSLRAKEAEAGADTSGDPTSEPDTKDHEASEGPDASDVPPPLGLQRVPIRSIQRGADVHTRHEIDRATVEQYATAMKAGAVFPPPPLCFDGETYWPGDGFHRIEAHLQAGHEDILADVRPGDRRAAILHALTCDRNLPRTNSDKRKAVELVLADAEWRTWSDREIASRCAVSAPLVAKIRKELGYVDRERTGKDGRRRKVAGIGPRSTPNCKRFPVDPETDDGTAAAQSENNEPMLGDDVDQPPAIYQYTGSLKLIMARVQVAVDETTELANKWRSDQSPDLEPSIPNLEEVAAYLQAAAEVIELNLLPAQICQDCGGAGDDCVACAGTGWFARSELSEDESADDPQRGSWTAGDSVQHDIVTDNGEQVQR